MQKKSELVNFAIFLGGVMIVTALIAPYFGVRLGVIEAFGIAGITLVSFGFLFRRFISRRFSSSQ